MTDEELAAIKERCAFMLRIRDEPDLPMLGGWSSAIDIEDQLVEKDIPALLREIVRLREALQAETRAVRWMGTWPTLRQESKP